MELYCSKKEKGFSLLEVIFTIAILAAAVFSLYGLFNISLKMVWETKARVGATQLANEKLEIARNLSYSAVGTVGGVVGGFIPENETMELNGIEYNVYTNVVYIDDPFDGTWNSDPVDPLTNDYKRLLVRVSWDSALSSLPVDFYTDIAAKNGEEIIGGGTLAIVVFDAGGLPVDLAEVHIYNNQVSPAVDMHTFTNAQGQLVLPGTKAAEDSYQITVTKAGYSTDKTYDANETLPSPSKPHLTIWEGRSTTDSYLIDKLSTLSVHVQDINGVSLGDLTIHVRGDKKIGTDGEGNFIYKFDQDKTTNIDGNIVLFNIEWGTYTITIAETSGYNISETNPAQPIFLGPNITEMITVILEPLAEHSLLTMVKTAEASPIAGATAHVTNTVGYDATLITGSAGQTFFTPLAFATTTVTVTCDGYLDYENEFIVNGYTTEPVVLVSE